MRLITLTFLMCTANDGDATLVERTWGESAFELNVTLTRWGAWPGGVIPMHQMWQS
jgi:hypothetical protein